MLQVDRLLVGRLERGEFFFRESHLLVRLIPVRVLGIGLDWKHLVRTSFRGPDLTNGF